MATPKKNANGDDMSMEEILQSIKKIIADEDTDAANTPAAQDGTDVASAPMGSDVLELSDVMVLEEEVPPSVDILQEIDAAVGTPEPVAAPVVETPPPAPVKAEPVQPAPIAPPQDNDVLSNTSRLLSEDAAHASAAAFQKVIQTHKATTPMPHFRNSETIEDLVLETLKPLLKEWLDANLPPMVERIVEREIRKLVD
jgi:cell pole-organizing protein PopZ